jgi:SHS family lactate transporter-like MFS transporter
MELLGHFRRLTPAQRKTFVACFLGWALDAFDFFIVVFCISSIATEFHAKISAVTEAIFLTLAMRPVGAFLFGRLADRWGRRPTLMVNIVAYSVCELASAFAPSLRAFLVLRAAFGVAMGGEWGVGAALALESLPAEGRGFFSGLLQEGYAVGYLLASLASLALLPLVHWRGMFVVGALPAALVLYVRAHVAESPAWEEGRAARRSAAAGTGQGASVPRHAGFFMFLGGLPAALVHYVRAHMAESPAWEEGRAARRPEAAGAGQGAGVLRHAGLFLFLVVLMFAFNSFSHGTQDLYPTFLEKDRGFSSSTVALLAVIYNVGALAGGICFGAWSERIGRRRAIVVAALLAIPIAPLWAFGRSAAVLALGGFLMQFMVQGAWGVIPAHLNELSPPALRGTVPGLAYQLGNLLSSRNGVLQAQLAERRFAGGFAPVLAATVVVVALLVAVVTACGREAKGADLGSAV